MYQNRQNLLVNCHIKRFLSFFSVTALLNILCIFMHFSREVREVCRDLIQGKSEIQHIVHTVSINSIITL